MRHLCENQELVAAICASLYADFLFEWGVDGPTSYALKEFQRTALVSTRFFYGMLPHIWKSINVLNLFRREIIPADEKTWRLRRTPGSISRETMSRFHFYAPYIKTLVVHSAYLTAEVQNWEPLIAYSKENELLPNLIKFQCEGFHAQAHSVFLPHSTREINIATRYPEDMDIADTSQVLQHAAHKCPGLYSLEFHPGPNTDVSTSMEALSNFKHLGHLVSTPIVLQSSALQTVARLPRLTTLSIKPNNRGHWDSSLCEQVPAGGFPVLSDLTLHLKKPQDAKRFWELLPLGVLKKLDLTLEVPSDNSEFISTLCGTSPQITELALRLDESNRDYQRVYRINADMFEHLARLPMESCSFESVKLGFEGAWAKVASSWPNLRFIECLDQPTTLEDLLVLSSNLPKLENIKCRFDLERAARTVGADWSPTGRPAFYPGLLNLVSSRTNIMKIAYGSKLRGLARYFAYFWPKMVVKSVEQYVSEDPDRDDPDMLAELSARHDALFGIFGQLVIAHVELYHKA
ncbi:hypothetical protein FRC10_010668 [Ceratobasidium sp. 414]|nr:hypothetical protein FRC10_010668 [Ceratobasidium sp. 414]